MAIDKALISEKLESLGDRLLACGNRPSGFDYMRLALASMVIVSHTFQVSYGKESASLITASFRTFGAPILPMFFALSGFLVAGSLERCQTLISFAGLRVVRLVPALMVETALSAVVLGLLFTSLPFRDYVSDPNFARYFLNIVGDVHFQLPGVFLANPDTDVNSQLWTLPWEMSCYATLIGLVAIRLVALRWVFLAAVLLLDARWALINLSLWWGRSPDAPLYVGIPGYVLIIAFLYGVVLYRFRDKVPFSRLLFVISAVIGLVCFTIPYFEFIGIGPLVYAVAYLGLCNPRRWRLIESGDYSYGVFIYGYPIQQAVAASMGPIGLHWWVNLMIALPLAYLFAAFSWWCVEKPALRLRKGLFRLEVRAMLWMSKSRLLISAWLSPFYGKSAKQEPALQKAG